MTLRCLLDGLLLPAELRGGNSVLVAYDGDEAFGLEAIEATYYELLTATEDEVLGLERAAYRLLRRAQDFRWASAESPESDGVNLWPPGRLDRD